jgi:hypothetical protein
MPIRARRTFALGQLKHVQQVLRGHTLHTVEADFAAYALQSQPQRIDLFWCEFSFGGSEFL